MSNLHSELEQTARRFVAAVLTAMSAASLSDLMDGPNDGRRGEGRLAGRPPGSRAVARPTSHAAATRGRRKRSSPEEVQRQKDIALAAAKSLKPGFGKGDVMKKAGSSVDLGRALGLLVADGKLTKKGDRRRTRYWVK